MGSQPASQGASCPPSVFRLTRIHCVCLPHSLSPACPLPPQGPTRVRTNVSSLHMSLTRLPRSWLRSSSTDYSFIAPTYLSLSVYDAACLTGQTPTPGAGPTPGLMSTLLAAHRHLHGCGRGIMGQPALVCVVQQSSDKRGAALVLALSSADNSSQARVHGAHLVE